MQELLRARVPATFCARCKGRKLLCGLPSCPFIQRFYAQVKACIAIEGDEAWGATPPDVVVGEKGYPRIFVGLSIPPGIGGGMARMYYDPPNWWGKLSMEDLVKLRSSMVRGLVRVDVEKPWVLRKYELDAAAVSTKPVDAEVVFEKRPAPRLSFSDRLAPQAPSAPAKNVKICSNPRVEKALEKAMNDDVTAQRAIVELYEKGVSIYVIQRALSMGLLGRRCARRLVPTRWAITAVDRAISRYLLSRIRGRPTINESQLFFVEYLGNRFWIYLQPGTYEIHWIEVWHPSTIYTQNATQTIVVYNHEKISGTPEYLDGGFEAAKLSVLEYLNAISRQARVFILREILPTYYAPVGNWHIRESVKHAFENTVAKDVDVREVVEHISSVSIDAGKAFEEYVHELRKIRKLTFFVERP